jgi:hypothetical protein
MSGETRIERARKREMAREIDEDGDEWRRR